jgi:hypothetical protein
MVIVEKMWKEMSLYELDKTKSWWNNNTRKWL